jgi:hypothetical protein
LEFHIELFKQTHDLQIPISCSTHLKTLSSNPAKVRNGVLEEVDADIRPPSPPPVYDRNGARVNTRQVRIKKAMTEELNRLVRYMQKNLPGYVPPADWRPQKLAKKLVS